MLYRRARVGESTGEIALAERVLKSTVQKVLRQATITGNLAITIRQGRLKLYSPRDERLILRIVRKTPKITYTELRDESGINLSRSTYRRLLRQNGILN